MLTQKEKDDIKKFITDNFYYERLSLDTLINEGYQKHATKAAIGGMQLLFSYLSFNGYDIVKKEPPQPVLENKND